MLNRPSIRALFFTSSLMVFFFCLSFYL
jgi:hypothetical protein